MSVQARDAVYTYSQAKGYALLVLLALAEYADAEGVAWPSVRSVAEKVNMPRETAHRQMGALLKAGEIIDTGERKRGARVYRIAVVGGRRSVTEDHTSGRSVTQDHGDAGSQQGVTEDHSDGASHVTEDHSERDAASPKPSGTVRTDADDCARASEVDQVREAAGVDPSKRLPQQWLDPWVEAELGRWKSLDLSLPEILAVLRAVAAKRGGPPSSPTYFAKPMQEAAGAKGRPALQPIEGGQHGKPTREQRAEERLRARLERARAQDLASGRG